MSALHGCLAQAASFYRAQLRTTPAAVQYLIGRGVQGEVAARFGLGYAPPGFSALGDGIGQVDPQCLEAAGLLARNEDRLYDRFRDRIMFPIHDTEGRIVGFGARLIEGEGPKYLNSPETAVFSKGEQLYGLYQAQAAMAAASRVYVVEGYLDVVMLHQAGIVNAVATLGTAVTEAHLQLLAPQVREICFCFDGDDPGRRAAGRALAQCVGFLSFELSARFLFLPEGEDPDSLVRKEGGRAFEHRADEAVSFLDYFVVHCLQGVSLEYAEGRARATVQAMPLLRAAGDVGVRAAMVEAIAPLVRMSAEEIRELI